MLVKKGTFVEQIEEEDLEDFLSEHSDIYWRELEDFEDCLRYGIIDTGMIIEGEVFSP